jgi:16S rRNA (cytosine967-C5)-methyltransferase
MVTSLNSGYRLLKPGGILVYSTCSTSKMQNEDIIEWFLEQSPKACLEKIPGIDLVPVAPSFKEHCIRLSPEYSETSGFFLARIRKPSS